MILLDYIFNTAAAAAAAAPTAARGISVSF
jgi:hypothetical protein